ncbi:motility associated factor glycosyltransferase family protein [Maridesulfovibrio ferrireducens]|uniref:motility associated factor glycosyltransferase family protein n=1 Tax=Maridesulfovibrio ferrireducens TaxID=246191 RepID=UPI001A27B8A3|nr:6-hydroxymethylpterin diphosphokinase MptE-like protein [Maridesulfovibrio ferrireducens]MBI9112485.1 motility associated factor glycosyltransferase family protein [Maridesulfovibrio ferrireducens]
MSAYPFLKENIEALETYNPPLYAWLSSQDFDEEKLTQCLFKNRWDILDWKMENGNGMFESFLPNLIYKDWIVPEKAETSATFIIGCNLGYGLNHVLMTTPDTHKVIVSEPNAEMLLACLGQTDYRPFMENGKLHFCPVDENRLMSIIKDLDLQFVYGKIYLRLDMPSQQIGPEYARWSATIRDKMESFSVEMTTLRLKQDVMVGNELENFSRTIQDGTISTLKNAGRGLGAVILGAGPSLAEFGPELAKNPGNAVYVTALQTLPAVQKTGLKPHFCMGLDYNESMLRVYEQLDREWAKDIPLIYSTKLDHKVLEAYPGPTIPMWTLGGLGTFAFNQHEEIFDAGSNVSITLNRFLDWCGFNQILLVGQDFAWKGKVSHAAGHQNAGATFPASALVRLKNADGENLTSSIQYMTSKREMEEDITKLKTPVFNLYGGCALIDGTKNVDMQKVNMNGLLASAPGSMDYFLTAMNLARTPRPAPRFESRSQKWNVSIRNATKKLEKLFRKLNKNQKEINKTFHDVYFFLRQDPLYLPYLYNEILDMAGLARAKTSYAPKDLPHFKKIAKKTIKKVRYMDRCLNLEERKEAA